MVVNIETELKYRRKEIKQGGDRDFSMYLNLCDLYS